ncbi:MAG: TonB-dependent receptor [Bacteroidota bacterium]|nr:TonB-dependent receptor [Bacteroidota bacterium]
MRNAILFCYLFLVPCINHAQEAAVVTPVKTDSTLENVTVTAFQSSVKWKELPAAIAVLTQADLLRYGNASFVPVLNQIPGVRMEERSPSSYRLSIRGSLLRSPFGIRNTKVYWNDLPLTDAGGNTYLNLVDLSSINKAEMLKGPAASMYGAGTGGVLLLQSDNPFTTKKQDHFSGSTQLGSYGMFQEQTGWTHQSGKFTSLLGQLHQQSQGYRDQSASRKDMIQWQAALQNNRQEFRWLLFYTDLYYQTPGGITLAQMQSNPRLSRQAAGVFPGAIQQKTAIYNKTFFGGLQHSFQLSEHWIWKSFLSANHTDFTNPFITNYEKRNEANYGAGTRLVYRIKKANTNLQWINGAEWLYNHSLINDFGNRNGVADTVQFKDDIYAKQWFLFSQAELTLSDRWTFTAGLSLNNQSYRYQRTTDPDPAFVKKSIADELTPRLAVLYRLSPAVSWYLLAAKGFSPPALAEIRPSDGNYYGNLNAESGWNIESGWKGTAFHRRLTFDLAAYFFRLNNAIVRRTNLSGAEYFVNAGGTRQNGIEAMFKYELIREGIHFIRQWQVWSSYSFQPYRFVDYRQGSIDYSGNSITGVPRNIWVSGMDLEAAGGWYANFSLNAVSRLPLTDANDVYAAAYQLAQLKLGCRITGRHHMQLDLYAGVDNLLNQSYSLGNDINALGKRYYNPAPERNLYTGILCKF